MRVCRTVAGTGLAVWLPGAYPAAGWTAQVAETVAEVGVENGEPGGALLGRKGVRVRRTWVGVVGTRADMRNGGCAVDGV
jgi:hypothetical protein